MLQLLIIALCLVCNVLCFQLQPRCCVSRVQKYSRARFMSDWSDFTALDEDDDLDELRVDMTDYAVEEDSQESDRIREV